MHSMHAFYHSTFIAMGITPHPDAPHTHARSSACGAQCRQTMPLMRFEARN
jgi:hypothetical protein